MKSEVGFTSDSKHVVFHLLVSDGRMNNGAIPLDLISTFKLYC